jgi:hypothetical protein
MLDLKRLLMRVDNSAGKGTSLWLHFSSFHISSGVIAATHLCTLRLFDFIYFSILIYFSSLRVIAATHLCTLRLFDFIYFSILIYFSSLRVTAATHLCILRHDSRIKASEPVWAVHLQKMCSSRCSSSSPLNRGLLLTPGYWRTQYAYNIGTPGLLVIATKLKE